MRGGAARVPGPSAAAIDGPQPLVAVVHGPASSGARNEQLLAVQHHR